MKKDQAIMLLIGTALSTTATIFCDKGTALYCTGVIGLFTAALVAILWWQPRRVAQAELDASGDLLEYERLHTFGYREELEADEETERINADYERSQAEC